MKTLWVLVALQACSLACVGYQAWELYERVGYLHRIAALVTLSMAVGASWCSLYDVYKLRRYMWTLARKAAAKRTTQAKARAAADRKYHT